MFTELMPMLRDRRVLISIAVIDGNTNTLRVNVIPQKIKDGENTALLTPLINEGTAEEFDADLPKILKEFVAGHLSLKQSLEQAKAEMDAADKAAKDEAAKKKAAVKKSITTAPAKPAEKKPEPAKPEPPKAPETVNMFEMAAANAEEAAPAAPAAAPAAPAASATAAVPTAPAAPTPEAATPSPAAAEDDDEDTPDSATADNGASEADQVYAATRTEQLLQLC